MFRHVKIYRKNYFIKFLDQKFPRKVKKKIHQKLLPDSTRINKVKPSMENNPLLIIEENDDTDTPAKAKEEDPRARLKVAMKNKKLKEEFFRENEINRTAEILNDDYENEIHKSILDLEDNASLAYSSDDDDDDDDEDEAINGTLHDENGVALRNYGPLVPSLLLPFYERRRLSECKEESESDEEIDSPTRPAITVTSTNGITHQTEIAAEVPKAKQRFVVTKTVEDDMKVSKPQPVSILKKTPSPPSRQKLAAAQQSPKKIRYEAEEALKDVSARKNSQTIHFPCSPSGHTSVKSIFSPQGILYPHLDKRYYDTSLVEIRTSQNQLITSTKSLDGTSTQPLNDIWIKQADLKQQNSNNNKNNDKISHSSDSITSSNCSSRKNDVSDFLANFFSLIL